MAPTERNKNQFMAESSPEHVLVALHYLFQLPNNSEILLIGSILSNFSPESERNLVRINCPCKREMKHVRLLSNDWVEYDMGK